MFFRSAPTEGLGVAFTDARVNLSDAQEAADRAAALATVAAAIGVPVATVRQVHGNRVLTLDGPTAGVEQEADALVTRERGLALAVRVADCVPVLLADDSGSVIGAAHAGRAGLLNGVLGETVAAMGGLGATGVRAWIGPHVCARCYEVPDALAASFADATGIAAGRTRQGTASIDLGAAARAQLAAAGVQAVPVGACTLHDCGLHSHRRDGTAAGRGAGLVWLSRADVRQRG